MNVTFLLIVLNAFERLALTERDRAPSKVGAFFRDKKNFFQSLKPKNSINSCQHAFGTIQRTYLRVCFIDGCMYKINL